MDHMNQDEKNRRDHESKADRIYSDGTLGYEEYKAPLWFVRSRNAIYYVLGVIEVLLAFRFLFKLLGANPRSGFVAFLYSMSDIFTAPFTGIFSPFMTNGSAANFVFEPSTLIAMAVYAVAAWGLVNLARLKVSRDGH